MLFKQEDLNRYDPIQEAADILNESVYLDESESILHPMAIPVVENARIGAHVVAFEDVERLAEDYGADYIDAMQAIAEANEIEMDSLAVSVPEWKIIADPEVVNELNNVIVKPISSNSAVYQLVEACIDAAVEEDEETVNESYIELLVESVEDNGRTVFGDKEGTDANRWGGKGDPSKIKELLNKAKSLKIADGRNKIASVLASLREYLTKGVAWQGKYRSKWESLKVLIAKAVDKLSKMIAADGGYKEGRNLEGIRANQASEKAAKEKEAAAAKPATA